MILDDIVLKTRVRVEMLHEIDTPDGGGDPSPDRIEHAIRSKCGQNAVIAEIKYASPSAGIIREPGGLEDLIRALELGGAAALSVLTEPHWFGGSLENISLVRSATHLPILRKDFIIDERQIVESRMAGADAVLLITSVIGERLPEFVRLCRKNSIEPFVEIHSREEIPLALASGATLIGINNRDLRTMQTNLSTTRIVSEDLCRTGVTIVSMSGICWPYDVRSLGRYCDGFLVGSSVMGSNNPEKVVRGFVCA